MEWYVHIIYAAWIVFTHVYPQFEIAPRVAMVSEEPDAGKSTARKVASHLVYRPNEEALGTAAAIRDYLDQGPGTILLDELDYLDADARRQLMKLLESRPRAGSKNLADGEGAAEAGQYPRSDLGRWHRRYF
jgi:hypothetical protein